jgi:hypothetical protein
MPNTNMASTQNAAAGVTATHVSTLFPGAVSSITGGVGGVSAAGSYAINTSTMNSSYLMSSGIVPSPSYVTIGSYGDIIAISSPSTGKEIVKIDGNGSVIWNNEVNIDAAAESFSKVLQLSAEKSAGISTSVKQRIRDTVFDEIIEFAKEKGSLNADDLTFMLRSIKIMDKLKDIK